ncbi:hypothetical protein [Streptomyces clavifer]|uniref:hypothetical protein n=1 Tax=Streptomyces clavifer TaxID=68188 RepID=UPI002E8127C4|nr:hypothetical protein [Streptomyces clavifer]
MVSEIAGSSVAVVMAAWAEVHVGGVGCGDGGVVGDDTGGEGDAAGDAAAAPQGDAGAEADGVAALAVVADDRPELIEKMSA